MKNMMKKEYSVISGNRVKLRPVHESDIETLRAWRNKNEIRKNFFNQSVISSVGQKAWFKSVKSTANDLMFIIETDKREPIGAIALYNIDLKNRSGELGRLMIGNRKYLGRGFATEAAEELVKFGFESLGLHRIYLQLFEDNDKAYKIYHKVGFKKEGLFRDAFFKTGNDYKNIIQMSILKDDFKK
jgi:UDP-4-amino-4,6-dideoxy-N-acetyl-beta-L-altrosamine N-acetyltransferase